MMDSFLEEKQFWMFTSKEYNYENIQLELRWVGLVQSICMG